MKKLKLIIALILALCLSFCMLGCEEDPLANFNPVGLRVVEKSSGLEFETAIEDQAIVQKFWQKFNELEIIDDGTATMGTAYIYMCFYDESETTLGVFTVYNNGSCCMGEDFTTFYTITDGLQAYNDFCEIHDEYINSNVSE